MNETDVTFDPSVHNPNVKQTPLIELMKVHVLIMITHGHITVMGLYESQGEAINAAQTIETLVEGKIEQQKDIILLEFSKGLDENQIQCNVPNSERTYLIQSL